MHLSKLIKVCVYNGYILLYINYTSIQLDLEEKKEVGARGGGWACGCHGC